MKKTLYIVGVVILYATFVMGAIPDTLNIHGKLLNNGGSPQTGTFSMNFSIYDVASGGANIYTQTQSVTTDENGIYTLILSGLTGVNFSQQTYLEIQVESDSPMTPRINITSTPSALAPEAGGGGSSLWTAGTLGDIYYDSGDVGIGVTNPTDALHIIDPSGGNTVFRIDTLTTSRDSIIAWDNNNGAYEEWILCFDNTDDSLQLITGIGIDCIGGGNIVMQWSIIGTKINEGKLTYKDMSVQSSCGNFGVRYDNFVRMRNTIGGCTVSAITHGTATQTLKIFCDVDDAGTTFTDDGGGSGEMHLNGDFVCADNAVLNLLLDDDSNDWIEVSRSMNG